MLGDGIPSPNGILLLHRCDSHPYDAAEGINACPSPAAAITAAPAPTLPSPSLTAAARRDAPLPNGMSSYI
uniref:Uncharacterized protein n=1 Tax=Oryza rufipogon TaxID=4529 RepID=A0A0E0QTZ1_ORYRU